MQVEPLRRKFAATTREWEQTTKDADMLEEELREEKVSRENELEWCLWRVDWLLTLDSLVYGDDQWLVVFRTSAAQTEDMLRSLEKMVAQSVRTCII